MYVGMKEISCAVSTLFTQAVVCIVYTLTLVVGVGVPVGRVHLI